MERLRLTQKERESLIKDITECITNAKDIHELGDIVELLPPISTKRVKKPKLFITAEAYLKMQELVKQYDVEISWHGLVKRDLKKNAYLIYDIILFPQINTSTSTSTEQEAYAKWLTEIMMDEDETRFNDMRMHGHSHVNMSVYSSAVDDTYQTDLLTNIEDDDFYIFMILNKKQEMCVLLYDYAQNIVFDTKDIAIHVISEDKKSITNWAQNQIKTYCKKPVVKYPRTAQATIYDYENYYGRH